MKPINTFFGVKSVSVILSCFLLCSSVNAQQNSFTSVQDSVRTDLTNSTRNLAAQRERIANEKVPLTTELNRLESDIRGLRNTAERVQAVRDSRELGLSDLQARLEAWENENTYLINLLSEYATRFESSLNISEIDRYRTEIDSYASARSATDSTSQVESQLALLDSGLTHIRDSLGGAAYEGNIVNEDGTLVAGNFTRFGPTVYFLAENKQLAGIVTQQQGLTARIFPMNQNLDDFASLANGNEVEIPVDVTDGRATAISSTKGGMLAHISQGGVWIFPILLFALVSLSISIVKAVQIYRIRMPTLQDIKQVLAKVESNELKEAQALADALPNPVGTMLSQGVVHATKSKELIEEVMYETMLDTQPKLSRFLPVIAITAATAPLLGLLGTVTGMINTFTLITLFGTGDARVLSSGISEALVTTEFGLVVAIPALIIHALLSRKVKSILGDMEKYALIFSNGLTARMPTREAA